MRHERSGERFANLRLDLCTGFAAPLLVGMGVCVWPAHAADLYAEVRTEPVSHDPHADTQVTENHGSMRGLYGPYEMSREASGTSWQPDSATMDGVHTMSGAWMLMVHGNLTGVYTHQSGPRGDSQTFNESMFMFMGRRAIGDDAVSVRAMASLEPLDGASGYPLLFQTGETANGRDELVDRQHPHNLLIELAGSYSKALSGASSIFVYAGPIGEPALGPPAFTHRASSDVNPDAPLTHHWLDSTHVSFGVVTVGAIWRSWKLEASSFNGREPNEHRYSVQFRAFDSSSVRLSYNPGDNLSLQVSTGRLASPEELQPNTAVWRTTASVIYDQPVGDAHWQTSLAWGRNAPSGGRRTDGYLLDSALRLERGHTVFGRLEHVVKDELFAPGEAQFGQAFLIQKASLGYIYDFTERYHLRFGVGGVASRYAIPATLVRAYGSDPASFGIFARARIVP